MSYLMGSDKATGQDSNCVVIMRAGSAVRAGALVCIDWWREPQECSAFPDIDQMLQDLPESDAHRQLRVCREYREFTDRLHRDIAKAFRIPKELLA